MNDEILAKKIVGPFLKLQREGGAKKQHMQLQSFLHYMQTKHTQIKRKIIIITLICQNITIVQACTTKN